MENKARAAGQLSSPSIGSWLYLSLMAAELRRPAPGRRAARRSVRNCMESSKSIFNSPFFFFFGALFALQIFFCNAKRYLKYKKKPPPNIYIFKYIYVRTCMYFSLTCWCTLLKTGPLQIGLLPHRLARLCFVCGYAFLHPIARRLR